MSYTLLGGIVWGTMVVKTGSLIPSIVLHSLFDVTMFVVDPGPDVVAGINTVWLVRRVASALLLLLVVMVALPLLSRARARAANAQVLTTRP